MLYICCSWSTEIKFACFLRQWRLYVYMRLYITFLVVRICRFRRAAVLCTLYDKKNGESQWFDARFRCDAKRGEAKIKIDILIISSFLSVTGKFQYESTRWRNWKKKCKIFPSSWRILEWKKISLFIFRRWSFFHVLSRLKWMEFLLKINIICNGDDDDDDDANTFLFGIYSTHPYSFIALLSSIFFFISFGKKLWRRNSTMEKKMCEANFGKFDGRHEIIDEIWIISTYFFTIN